MRTLTCRSLEVIKTEIKKILERVKIKKLFVPLLLAAAALLLLSARGEKDEGRRL